jgi:large subunit ribosomal protein L4
MKKQVFDTKGNKKEEITISDKVFGIEPNMEIIKQYIRVYRSNQRQGTSSTKTRSEVSGSGKKPWSQKGTGRARVGTKRNPIWRTGGVAHGPTPKSWNLNLTKKVRKLALKSALSTKVNKNNGYLIDKIEIKEPKTKEMLKIMDNLKLRGKTLFILDSVDEIVQRSGSNIKNLSITFVDNINAYELLNNKNVVLTVGSVKKLEERYKK